LIPSFPKLLCTCNCDTDFSSVELVLMAVVEVVLSHWCLNMCIDSCLWQLISELWSVTCHIIALFVCGNVTGRPTGASRFRLLPDFLVICYRCDIVCSGVVGTGADHTMFVLLLNSHYTKLLQSLVITVLAGLIYWSHWYAC